MILLVHGPNVWVPGEGGPATRDGEPLADVARRVGEACAAHGLSVKSFHSNCEGALLDFLAEHRAVAEGVILNAGSLAHTSRALHDAVAALPCPTVEVHLSNVHAREAWRMESVIAPATVGQISGLGTAGYVHAAEHLCARAAERDARARGAPRELRSVPAAAAPPAGRAVPRPPTPRPSLREDAVGDETENIPVDLNARGDYEP
ncbi:MAG: type II 3-dehydroquinate dehydratase [Anaeromyxobacteraceae bacterium]